MGVTVLELDPRIPFTAARARNEGFARLRALAPELQFTQFVDGDCELAAGWLQSAARFLATRADIVAVCGRLRERNHRASIYNLLCDIEWDLPEGETKSCGGIAMLRAEALERAGGYRADLIAGEEPELCVRLRAAGGRVWRLDADMASHDAAVSRFGQWWKRMVRTGHAFAQGAHLHGAGPDRYGIRECRSAWFWGLALPIGVCVLALCWTAWALALLAIYPLQIVRLAARGRRTVRENLWHALFLVLGKFPEMIGQVKFLYHRVTHTQSQLIEYK